MEQLFRWVKASERLPKEEGRYFVNTNRPFLPDNYETKQVATFTRHGEWYLENHHHSHDFFYMKPYEWLEEISESEQDWDEFEQLIANWDNEDDASLQEFIKELSSKYHLIKK